MPHNIDPTTGLLLRSGFEAAARIEAAALRPFAIAVVDVDGLGLINRTRGFNAGDAVLRSIAQRLVTVVSRSDTVAHLAGDSFVILLTDTNTTTAKVTGERLRRAIDDFPIVVDHKPVNVSISVGISSPAQVPGPTPLTVNQLLDHALAAVAAAKITGRNRVVEASSTDTDQVAHLLEASLVDQINTAIAQDQFALHAQEIHPLGDFQHAPSIELLIRMKTETDLLIGAEAFIPRAEEHNVIHRIDLWVLQRLGRYLRMAETAPHMFFVNVSPKSIETPGFVDELTGLLREHPGTADRICFELTETAAINHFDKVVNFIDETHRLGAMVALDDFGSGTSSLGQLRHLPVDYLKIDGSLTRNVATDATARTLILAIGSIAAVNNMITVAEHVESEPEALVLRDLGIHLAQGFHLSRPELFAPSAR